ncbi:WD40-repeat-containing domain protein [Gymnopilus junonius]|uniref:WD40-repeat-containing domain protein n=1 Tax=Gymnopilus junonius TaxID=109634 RepID=A0A9P5NDM8_GYMJU|nr:WD40-repeat-containing domain protein [Gymnopilus junonius]
MDTSSMVNLLKHECRHSLNGRNLVLFIDGTSNQFGENNTNVVELHNLVLKEIGDHQLTWYQSGIGTYAQPSWKSWKYFEQVLDNKVDLAIAWNFQGTVHDAYEWLTDNYQAGDCIFLFGFSRGAYQVRVLAGMIDKVGLLHKGNKKQIEFAFEIYEDSKSDEVKEGAEHGISSAEHFKRGFSHKNVRVHFVGAWDTVSSIGLVRGKRMLPRTVDGMKHVCYFRHALALDEHTVVHDTAHEENGELPDEHSSYRSGTPTTMSSHTVSNETNRHTKEVWFAGTHSDIGGGNVKNEAMDRGRPPLRWMASEAAEAGLRLEKFDRELSLKEQVEVRESLTFPWRFLEVLPLKRLTFDSDKAEKATTHMPHLGASRKIKYGQKIHSSVLLADTDIRYTPKAKPPGKIDPKKFWDSLREGKEAFEEWVEADMQMFMNHLVKGALAEHKNPLLENLLIPASTRGRQGLYKTVVDALGNSDAVFSVHVKNQLLTISMHILRKTSSVDKLQLIPSVNVTPLVSDLLMSSDQDHRLTGKMFLDTFTDPCVHIIPEEGKKLLSVIYSPDGNWIVSSPDSVVKVRDAEMCNLARENKSIIRALAYSPTARLLASGSEDKTIKIWDPQAEVPAKVSIDAHDDSVWAVKFSPDGKYLVSGSLDKTVKLWDTVKGTLVGDPFRGHTNQVGCVAYSPDGMFLASGSADRTVRIWSTASRNSTAQLWHTCTVFSLSFSPDSRRLVSGSWDGIVRVWDLKTKKVLFKCKGHEGCVAAVSFSPDGVYIASGSHDKTVRIFEAETGKQVRPPFEGHTSEIEKLEFSSDGKRLMSSAQDSIRVWDIEMLKLFTQRS